MLNAIIDILPDCRVRSKVIFAATRLEAFALLNNLALAYVALARREQELKGVLSDIPPSLYGLVGDLLQRLENAREAGGRPHELLRQSEGLIKVARQLGQELRPRGEPTGTVQLIIATGGSIVRNVTQQIAL